MEQAIFIARPDHLKYCNTGFSRLYFGNEFCERLLPSVADLESVLGFVREKGLDFTLVSPYVTNKGLKRLEPLLAKVAEAKPGSELVFNDFGVLRTARERYAGLEPVMGRLLHRVKRGPRLMTVIDKLPATTVDYFRSSNLTVPILSEFLNRNGVRRVEMDNVLQGFDFAIAGNVSLSLYVPFAYISTTRFCLSASCDDPEKEELIGIFPCQQECQKYTFYLRSEIMPLPLIRKGNAIFFENPVLPEGLEAKGVTRIVAQPEIPI